MNEELSVTDELYRLSCWVLPAMAAIILHEIAHGYAALYFGDDTAKREGRLSLNPFKHVDPFGTVIFPLFLVLVHAPFMFGWAKPVPVDFSKLKKPKSQMAWVAAAGPACNFAQALLCLTVLSLCKHSGYIPSFWVQMVLVNTVLFNLSLMIFNLIPVLPMDGGRILTGILPLKAAIRFAGTEKYGFVVIVSLLILVPMLGDYIGRDFDFVSYFLAGALQRLVSVLAGIFGI